MSKNKRILVIGVGGSGNNAINRIVKSNITGFEFWVMNTDKDILNSSICDNKLQLGANTTNGLGACGNPEIGENSAREAEEDIQNAIKEADLVFIIAGLGGGTGTGATPVIADIAKANGITTICMVTTPFEFEGGNRIKKANIAIEKLSNIADYVFMIKNDSINFLNSPTLKEAFGYIDNLFVQIIKAVSTIKNFDMKEFEKALADTGLYLVKKDNMYEILTKKQ